MNNFTQEDHKKILFQRSKEGWNNLWQVVQEGKAHKKRNSDIAYLKHVFFLTITHINISAIIK